MTFEQWMQEFRAVAKSCQWTDEEIDALINSTDADYWRGHSSDDPKAVFLEEMGCTFFGKYGECMDARGDDDNAR